MLLFHILLIILLITLFANYKMGTFRLSKRTYLSLSTFAISFILGTTSLIQLNDTIKTIVLIISVISFFVTYYFISHEKSTDVEKMILDIQEMIKTGKLDDAAYSSLLSTDEKEKIDSKIQKLNNLSNRNKNK